MPFVGMCWATCEVGRRISAFGSAVRESLAPQPNAGEGICNDTDFANDPRPRSVAHHEQKASYARNLSRNGWRAVGRGAVIAALTAASPIYGQTQPQVQYVYDAAGNLIQMTRSNVTPSPDLVVSDLSVGTITAGSSGSANIPVTFRVTNIGTAAAAATWYDRGFLSPNSTLVNTDQALGGFNTRTTNLAIGASYTVTTTFITSTTTAAGNYTLIVKADGGTAASGQFSPTGANAVPESNETNNTQYVAITIPAPLPDLVMSSASIGAVTESQNGSYTFPVTFTVGNIGGVPASPSWFDLVYLSADNVLDNSDLNLGYISRGTALAVSASYTATGSFSTPTTTAPGTYTLFVKADGHGASIQGGTNTDTGSIVEGNEANNVLGLSITLPAKPDLAISSASVGAIAENQNGSYNIPVTFTVSNIGGTPAQPNWYDIGYLSTDGVLDNADLGLGAVLRGTALAPGASYTTNTTFTTPTPTTPGTYTLFVKADGEGPLLRAGTNTDSGAVAEGNETNNVVAVPITLPTMPDLVMSNVTVGTITLNADGSHSIPVTWTVTNGGGVPAIPNWFDMAYLSTDAVLDNADLNLGYLSRTTALAVGSSYTVSATFTTLTTTAAGTYTLFMKADGDGSSIRAGTNTDSGTVVESNEANNVVAVTVVLH